MKLIRLSKNDIEFMLLSLKDMPENLADKLKQLGENKIKPEDISIDEYDSLRDLCGDWLQMYGFDENYNPTKEGEMLENLIDKLYTD